MIVFWRFVISLAVFYNLGLQLPLRRKLSFFPCYSWYTFALPRQTSHTMRNILLPMQSRLFCMYFVGPYISLKVLCRFCFLFPFSATVHDKAQVDPEIIKTLQRSWRSWPASPRTCRKSVQVSSTTWPGRTVTFPEKTHVQCIMWIHFGRSSATQYFAEIGRFILERGWRIERVYFLTHFIQLLANFSSFVSCRLGKD